MTRLLMMGPPGAGKGTQSQALATRLGVPAISTGDIFRANVAQGTELGRRAQQYMDAGDYVPDSVTNGMVRDRLAQPDARAGFLLDGYPRTHAQVEELDSMLDAEGSALDAVVALRVPAEELVQRLVQRAETDGRSDDTEDVVRRRHRVYEEQTAPLLATYRRRGQLVEVDGTGSVETVADRVLARIDQPDGQS